VLNNVNSGINKKYAVNRKYSMAFTGRNVLIRSGVTAGYNDFLIS
jgi:hypothetical protein